MKRQKSLVCTRTQHATQAPATCPESVSRDKNRSSVQGLNWLTNKSTMYYQNNIIHWSMSWMLLFPRNKMSDERTCLLTSHALSEISVLYSDLWNTPPYSTREINFSYFLGKILIKKLFWSHYSTRVCRPNFITLPTLQMKFAGKMLLTKFFLYFLTGWSPPL